MYYLRKPQIGKTGAGQRASFKIAHRTDSGLFTKTKTLELEEIESINREYLRGSLEFERALAMAEEVLKGLQKQEDLEKGKNVFNSDNLKILDRYWKAVYTHKDLVDPGSMEADLKRAIAAIGILSLLSASKVELQNELKKRLAGRPNIHRRVVARLNQLLKFVGRDFQLVKMREVFTEIKYLTEPDFEKFSTQLEDRSLRILCGVAFYTGMRLGECFAIRRMDLKSPEKIHVAFQIDDQGNRRATKNRKTRDVFVPGKGMDWLKEWLDLPEEERIRLRGTNHARTVKLAASKAFPENKEKWIVFHDLRHSYAILLLGRNMSLSFISKFLGNTIFVCEKYYTGFSMSDSAIETAKRIYNQSFSKKISNP